jgi:hypothetical protein
MGFVTAFALETTITLAGILWAMSMCCHCWRCCFKCCHTSQVKLSPYDPPMPLTPSSKRMRWMYAFLALVGVCASIAVADGAAKAADGVDRGFAGAIDSLTGLENFVCTSTVELADLKGCGNVAARQKTCLDKSLVGFLSKIQNTTHGVLSTAGEFVEDVSGDIVSGLRSASNGTIAIGESIDSMVGVVDTISNDSKALNLDMAELNAYFEAMAAQAGQASSNIDPNSIPDVSENLQAVKSAAQSIKAASETSQESATAAEEAIDTQIKQQANDGIQSANSSVSQLVCDFSDQMLDVGGVDTAAGKQNLREMRDQVGQYKTAGMAAYGGLVFLVSVLPFLCGMRGISKARLGPNRLGGCCIWLTIFYVILFAGIAHFMYEVLGDTCPNLELIVETNAPASFKLGDTNITDLGGKLTAILDCQQGQNFVGLLGADQVFNTTDKVEAIFTSVDAAIVGISNSTGQLDDAIVQAESAKDGFSKSVTGGSGVAFDAPALVTQINDTKTKCNGTDDTSRTYLWTYNRSQVENCRAVCTRMVGTVGSIDTNITSLDALQANAGAATDDTIRGFRAAASSISAISPGLTGIKSKVSGLVSLVADGPSHTGCAFFGNAYRTVVKTALCDNLRLAFGQLYFAGAVVYAVMFLGWFLLWPWREESIINNMQSVVIGGQYGQDGAVEDFTQPAYPGSKYNASGVEINKQPDQNNPLVEMSSMSGQTVKTQSPYATNDSSI